MEWESKPSLLCNLWLESLLKQIKEYEDANVGFFGSSHSPKTYSKLLKKYSKLHIGVNVSVNGSLTLC